MNEWTRSNRGRASEPRRSRSSTYCRPPGRIAVAARLGEPSGSPTLARRRPAARVSSANGTTTGDAQPWSSRSSAERSRGTAYRRTVRAGRVASRMRVPGREEALAVPRPVEEWGPIEASVRDLVVVGSMRPNRSHWRAGSCTTRSPSMRARDPRGAESRLPGSGRDRRHGGLRARADPAARRRAPDLRLTALVNREAAGEDLGIEQVSSRCTRGGASEWVRGEQQHVPRLAARGGRATSCTRSAARRRCAGRVPRVTTIHDLNYSSCPDAHFGVRGLGMRRARPGRRAPLAARSSSTPSRRARPGRSISARRRRRSTSCRSASPPPPTVAADAAARAARAARARRRARSCSASRPSARTRTSRGCCARSPRSRPSAGPLLVRARLPDAARGGAARARRASSASRRRALPALGLGGRARGSVRAGDAASCSRRSTRASGCRCSRRWRAACRSHARTAPRCRRWPATPRCCSTPTDVDAIRAAIERLLADDALRERLAGGRPRAGRALHVGGAPRELTRRQLPPALAGGALSLRALCSGTARGA